MTESTSALSSFFQTVSAILLSHGQLNDAAHEGNTLHNRRKRECSRLLSRHGDSDRHHGVAKAMFSGFAELGRSLFVGVAQILHGRIDT